MLRRAGRTQCVLAPLGHGAEHGCRQDQHALPLILTVARPACILFPKSRVAGRRPPTRRSYAGRAFEREDQARAGGGELICKGMRSMWRQARLCSPGAFGACSTGCILLVPGPLASLGRRLGPAWAAGPFPALHGYCSRPTPAQSAPILRTTLHGALVRLLMEDDLRWAAE